MPPEPVAVPITIAAEMVGEPLPMIAGDDVVGRRPRKAKRTNAPDGWDICPRPALAPPEQTPKRPSSPPAIGRERIASLPYSFFSDFISDCELRVNYSDQP